MAVVPQSKDELESILQEHIAFLKASAASFDAGFEGEIKRLAVSVRVLVYDTQQSTSLLAQLGKKSIPFADTAIPYDENSKISHSSLVQIHLTPQGGIPRPRLDSPMYQSSVPFDLWWNGVVLVDHLKNEFSRKDIVLILANKEGGAHVDPELDSKYFDLRKNNALGWIQEFSDGRQLPGADHVPATMRQIAHELIKSLEPSYTYSLPPIPGTSIVFAGMKCVQAPHYCEDLGGNLRKDRPIVGGKRVGRNDPCPCGSGKKYKKCCMQ